MAAGKQRDVNATASGAMAGASIGTAILPGVGTAIGAGVGAFGGIGLHLTINPRYTIQVLYTPSYDRINLGYTPNFKLQHGVGLRVYYNVS
jgi:hypothetical protein